MSEKKVRIAAIIGTTRPGNYTSRALDVVIDELKKRGAEVERVDPADYDLRLPGLGGDEAAEALQARVKDAAGVVLSTPEYHGSMSAALKLVIENLGFPSALAGKPVALLGVAAGVIGAIKSLEQLRSVASHVGAIVLPGPVSVAGVGRMFGDDGTVTDEGTEKRLRSLAAALMEYIRDHDCPEENLEEMVR